MSTASPVTPAELLAAGRHLLGRAGSAGGGGTGVWPRAVAVLSRQALELALASLWQRKGLDMTGASARAQLLCLDEYVPDADVAADARFVWWALSRACHHHPYELAPVVGELEGWLSTVAGAVAAIEALP